MLVMFRQFVSITIYQAARETWRTGPWPNMGGYIVSWKTLWVTTGPWQDSGKQCGLLASEKAWHAHICRTQAGSTTEILTQAILTSFWSDALQLHRQIQSDRHQCVCRYTVGQKSKQARIWGKPRTQETVTGTLDPDQAQRSKYSLKQRPVANSKLLKQTPELVYKSQSLTLVTQRHRLKDLLFIERAKGRVPSLLHWGPNWIDNSRLFPTRM